MTGSVGRRERFGEGGGGSFVRSVRLGGSVRKRENCMS